LEHSERSAVAGYLEVFILIGVAVAGTAVVFGAAQKYSATLEGPSISISEASIRQGTYVALETLAVYNSGEVPASSFYVSTPQAPSSASYCYAVLNPATMIPVASTCPSMSANPTSVEIPCSLPPGGALLVEIAIAGADFAVGSSSAVTVTTSAGAQATVSVQPVPA
jgi:hypothetical protein